MTSFIKQLQEAKTEGKKLLAILIDPEKFDPFGAPEFVRGLPKETTHLFIGGSTVPPGLTERTIAALKLCTAMPLVLFPGDYTQIAPQADALLFLSLVSGNNPEYLIGQQRKATRLLNGNRLEVVPTAYILIDGGNTSAVSQVTATKPMSQEEPEEIALLALTSQFLGKQCIYLEAGSGALYPVLDSIVSLVAKRTSLPLIVGGGIKNNLQKELAYTAGATMVVMGTAFENQ